MRKVWSYKEPEISYELETYNKIIPRDVARKYRMNDKGTISQTSINIQTAREKNRRNTERNLVR